MSEEIMGLVQNLVHTEKNLATLNERRRIIQILEKNLGHVDWPELLVMIAGEKK